MKHVVGVRKALFGGYRAFCEPCDWQSDPVSAEHAQAEALAHQGGTLHTNEKRVSPLRVPRTGDGMTDEAFPGVK